MGTCISIYMKTLCNIHFRVGVGIQYIDIALTDPWPFNYIVDFYLIAVFKIQIGAFD